MLLIQFDHKLTIACHFSDLMMQKWLFLRMRTLIHLLHQQRMLQMKYNHCNLVEKDPAKQFAWQIVLYANKLQRLDKIHKMRFQTALKRFIITQNGSGPRGVF